MSCHDLTALPFPDPGDAKSALLFLGHPQGVDLAVAFDAAGDRWDLAPFSAPDDTLMALVTYPESLDQLLLDPGPLALAGPGTGRPLPPGTLRTRTAGLRDDWTESEIPAWLVGAALPEVTDAQCAAHGGCFVIPEEAADPICKVPCEQRCADFAGLDRLPPGPIPLIPDCELSGPERGSECWSDPIAFDGINSGLYPDAHDQPGSFTVEGGRTLLYFASDRDRGGDDSNFTRTLAVEMTAPGQLDVGTLEDLEVIPPASQDPLGWLSTPQVRDDATELFLHGSWPDAYWWDEEIFVSTRGPEGWSRLVTVDALADPSNGQDPDNLLDQDEVRSPLLLPDYRTLIYSAPSAIAQQQQFARRPSTRAGDLRFEPLRVSPFELNRATTDQHSLSCDRRHIFYVYFEPTTHEPELRIVAIRSLEPLTFGQPHPVKDVRGQPLRIAPTRPSFYAVESPDCQTLYLSDQFRTFYSTRAPCL